MFTVRLSIPYMLCKYNKYRQMRVWSVIVCTIIHACIFDEYECGEVNICGVMVVTLLRINKSY